jgi:predicted HAD superfamily Cof-like phosphohydrolase
MSIHDQVLEFMRRVPTQRTPPCPTVPSRETLKLRYELIAEEFDEYNRAVGRVVTLAEEGACGHDLIEAWAEIGDALADLHYVVAGAGIAWGLPMPAIQDEVHRANMAKFGPGSWIREDGKQMKPPDWTPPNHRKAIEKALNDGSRTD